MELGTTVNKTNLLSRLDLRLQWILPTLIRPKKTIEEIVKKDKSVWLTPLLIISVLVIIASLIGGPIRKNAIVSGANLPADFQYYSAEQQAQFMNAQATQSSALFTMIFPMAGTLIGVWFSWFLLSSLLHLSLTLSGSRASSMHSYNLVGWSMVPIIVREVVQIIAMIFSHSVVTSAGLSGFIASDVKGGLAFIAGILGQIDIYLIWQIVLILLGVTILSGLSRTKAWMATGISFLILVILLALPRLATSMLSGLSTGGFYF